MGKIGKTKKKKDTYGIWFILAAAFAVIILFSLYGRKLKLNYIEQIHLQNGYLYYVDRGEDEQFRIIRSDTDGRHGKIIACSRHRQGTNCSIRQIFFDEKGNAYVLLEEIDIKSCRQTSCQVYYCNFKTEKLERTDYDLMQVCMENYRITLQGIRDGLLYYFSIPRTESGQGEVSVCVMDGQGDTRILDTILLKNPYLKAEFFLSENGVLLWMTDSGEVYARELESRRFLELDGITGVKGSFQGMCNDGRYMVYILDHRSDCVRKVNLRFETTNIAFSARKIQEQDPDFTFQGLRSLDSNRTGFCASLEGTGGDDNESICSFQNGVHQDIGTIRLTAFAVFRRMLSVYVLVIILSALLCGYWYVYCVYQLRTILVRLVLVFMLGLFAADTVLGQWIEKSMRRQLEQNQILALTVIGEELRAHIVSEIEKNDGALPENEILCVKPTGVEDMEWQETEVYVYSFLKDGGNGNLVVYESESEYRNVPAKWCYGEDSLAAIREAYDSQKSVNISDETANGRCSSRFLPVVLSDGKVCGLLAVSVTGNIMDYQVWYYERMIKILSVFLLTGLSVVLLLILVFFLKPLKTLKACAGKLAAGELGITVPVRGRDEVADISMTFNQMSLGLARYVQDIREMSDGYYKFIPAKILDLLGRESIQQLKLGDQIVGNMTVLSLHTIDYPKQKPLWPAEKVYQDINQILSILVEPIEAHHGVVEHFEDSGLSAFFTENSKEALDAAIQIHKSMDGQMPEKDRSIAISFGRVMIGVIGHKNRMEAAAISASSDLARALRLKGDKYGARILITHLACRQIPGFEEHYHARYLGNIYNSANDTLERLYDVYDADTEEEFYYKELTKPLFEKGVELYVAKKFFEARLIFVEVLKQHRRDRAAKEYLYRCDRYYKLSDEETETVIEKF